MVVVCSFSGSYTPVTELWLKEIGYVANIDHLLYEAIVICSQASMAAAQKSFQSFLCLILCTDDTLTCLSFHSIDTLAAALFPTFWQPFS